jgi:hypothetical protein
MSIDDFNSVMMDPFVTHDMGKYMGNPGVIDEATLTEFTKRARVAFGRGENTRRAAYVVLTGGIGNICHVIASTIAYLGLLNKLCMEKPANTSYREFMDYLHESAAKLAVTARLFASLNDMMRK